MWTYCYDIPLPPAISEEELDKNMKAFTLKEVKDWVDKHDGIAGALCWFETYAANNVFYQKNAKPMLSTRTTGSIGVGRTINPIKGCILTP